jgi:hypothetical protein
MLNFKLKGSLKAGPNGKVSLMTFANDAVAFLHYPSKIFDFVCFNIHHHGFRGAL